MKKDFNYKKLLINLALIVFVFIGVPLAVYGLSVPTIWANGGNDWSGFWGGYLGSIIGAVVAIYGVRVTLKETRYQSKEDKRIEYIPLLKIEKCDKRCNGEFQDLIYVIDEESDQHAELCLKIKNFGIGPAINLNLNNLMFIKYNGEIIENKNNLFNNSSTKEILEIEEESTAVISVSFQYPDITQIKFAKSGVLSLDLSYEDIFENQYFKHIRLHFGVAYDFKNKNFDRNFCISNISKEMLAKERRSSLYKYHGKEIDIVGFYEGFVSEKKYANLIGKKKVNIFRIIRVTGIMGFDIYEDSIFLETNIEPKMQRGDKVQIKGTVVKCKKDKCIIRSDYWKPLKYN